MKKYLCTHMFLQFALLPALVLCMVTPPEESSKRKRPLALNIDESLVPAKRVNTNQAASLHIEKLVERVFGDVVPASQTHVSTQSESMKRKQTPSPIALEIPVPAERVPTPHFALLQTETLAERVFSDPNGPITHVATYLDAKDFDNIMHSTLVLRKPDIFYSKRAFSIPFDATEDSVRRMISSYEHIEKVTIGNVKICVI
jgi:hypothetical protein